MTESVLVKHSASRALALIKAMNLRPVSSVRELASDTGISKPSVVRLLAILMEDGFVQRASGHGNYSLTREVEALSSGFRDDTTMARAAGPIMDALTADIQWPTALGFFEQGSMVVRYSTIPSSPLAWYRTTLYLRLPLLRSGMGQVFLAFSDPATRQVLLNAYNDEQVSPAEKSEQFFERVRERGYGLRAATMNHPTFSISVPIIVGNRIVGALSATIYARAMQIDEAIAKYVSPLKKAVADIISASGLADEKGSDVTTHA